MQLATGGAGLGCTDFPGRRRYLKASFGEGGDDHLCNASRLLTRHGESFGLIVLDRAGADRLGDDRCELELVHYRWPLDGKKILAMFTARRGIGGPRMILLNAKSDLTIRVHLWLAMVGYAAQ